MVDIKRYGLEAENGQITGGKYNMLKKRLPMFVAVLLGCSVLVGVAPTIEHRAREYRVEPEVTVPPYETDTARAINAYERLMDRYLDLTQANLIGVGSDVRAVAGKLDRMDSKLTELAERLTRIEKALGIDKAEPQPEQKSPESPPQP